MSVADMVKQHWLVVVAVGSLYSCCQKGNIEMSVADRVKQHWLAVVAVGSLYS